MEILQVCFSRELGIQQAKSAASEDTASNITSRMTFYEEELSNYKSQVETLKTEIENQERSYKTQLAVQEKKAHDNWVILKLYL